MCTHSEIQNKLSWSRKLFDLQLNLKNDECCKDFSPLNIDPDKAIIVMKIWVFFFFFLFIFAQEPIMWVNSLDLPHHDHCSEYLEDIYWVKK